MIRRSCSQQSKKLRSGFTLIELLVVISIIAVLASLVAPAVQSARRAARKVQCLSNMRNVGLAMQNFASANNGNLPSLVSYPTVTNTNGAQGTFVMPWTITLLPYLDNSALLKNIKNDAVYTAGPPATMAIYVGAAGQTSGSNSTVSDGVAIEVFGCPDGVNAYKKQGGLSYVVNAGHMSSAIWGVTASVNYNYPNTISWSGAAATDSPIGLATGVFWPSVDASGNALSSSIDYVSTGDGTTTTIMLSENLQAGTWYGTLTPSAPTGYAGVNGLGFGISFVVANIANFYQYAGAIQTPPQELFIKAASTPDTYFINRNLSATVGAAPRPSSQHAQGVNIVMCDGSGRFLGETVDHTVYMKLMTSNGVAYGEQALDQSSY